MYNTILFFCFFFSFTDTSTTEIYTLSLHDALPIWRMELRPESGGGYLVLLGDPPCHAGPRGLCQSEDRKSTRLNSSHVAISYAVFCLKKKKKNKNYYKTKSKLYYDAIIRTNKEYDI